MKTMTYKSVLIGVAAAVLVLAGGLALFFSSDPSDQSDHERFHRQGPRGQGPQDRGSQDGELAALEGFLTMSDEELERLETAIARIRAMSEEERARFSSQILAFRGLPGEERQRLREGWGRYGEREREEWRIMMRELSPAERREIHESLQDLPGAERTERRLEIIEAWRQSR